MKRILYISTIMLLCNCSSQRQLPQVVERVHRDTLYRTNLQYDSIYILHDRTTDYHLNPLNPLKPSETDTLFIHDRTVEYRYRLLRDTVYRTRIDSIPYEVTIVETKVERYVPWWAKLLSWIGAIALILLLARLLLLLRGR